MKLKSIIFALSMLPVFLFAQPAESQHDPGKRAKHRTEKMTQELGLTAEQATQIEALNLETATKMQALHSNEQRSPATRQQAKAIKEAHNASLATILTDTQLQKVEAQRVARREGHHQQRHEKKGNKQQHRPNPQMKKEMRAYAKENIHPAIVEQRLKLDEIMSKKDRKKVAKLRRQMMALKEEGKAMRQEFKQNKSEGECTPESCKADRKAKAEVLRSQMKPIKEEAKKIADTYALEINALKSALAPEMQQWKTDMKAIEMKYQPEGRPQGPQGQGRMPGSGFGPPPGQDQGPDRGKGHPKPPGHDSKRKRHTNKLLKLMKPANFILMDPNAPFPEKEGHNMRSDANSTKNPGLSRSKNIRLFPNPSTTVSKLEYEVEAAGVVKVELLDKNAASLEVLLEEFKEAGTHLLEVNTSGLKNHEVYIFRVTDKMGTGTQRVLIKR